MNGEVKNDSPPHADAACTTPVSNYILKTEIWQRICVALLIKRICGPPEHCYETNPSVAPGCRVWTPRRIYLQTALTGNERERKRQRDFINVWPELELNHILLESIAQ